MAASAVPIRSELQDARRILETADQYTWRKNDGSSPGQLFPKILPYSKLLGFTDDASFKKVYFSSARRQLEINLNFALATSARGFADGAEREVGPHLMGWILQQAQSDPVITAARLAAIYGFNARQWKETLQANPDLIKGITNWVAEAGTPKRQISGFLSSDVVEPQLAPLYRPYKTILYKLNKDYFGFPVELENRSYVDEFFTAYLTKIAYEPRLFGIDFERKTYLDPNQGVVEHFSALSDVKLLILQAKSVFNFGTIDEALPVLETILSVRGDSPRGSLLEAVYKSIFGADRLDLFTATLNIIPIKALSRTLNEDFDNNIEFYLKGNDFLPYAKAMVEKWGAEAVAGVLVNPNPVEDPFLRVLVRLGQASTLRYLRGLSPGSFASIPGAIRELAINLSYLDLVELLS